MNVRIVIGKSFGDEGKGLAVDYFSDLAEKSGRRCLVIRHNGGAQAGHTVDLQNGRFVFHQLSSGSFRSADTLWADTFLPDLFKLPEEAQGFFEINRTMPEILSFGGCQCVVIDDVLVNMALETSRGHNRHGSCGMGIDEAVQRSKLTQFRLPLSRVKSSDCDGLYHELRRLRRDYLPLRLNALGLSLKSSGEYGELLQNDNVLLNAAQGMCEGAQLVEIVPKSRASEYDEVVFEGAQGLLLDELNLDYAPHLTSSRTGLFNPLNICRELFGGAETEAVYVTRSYVTRHGAGRLPHEGRFAAPLKISDPTNIPNEWQGAMRLAPHGAPDEFIAPIIGDCGAENISRSLMITHLNETNGKIYTVGGEPELSDWYNIYGAEKYFDRIYLSYSPLSYKTTTF